VSKAVTKEKHWRKSSFTGYFTAFLSVNLLTVWFSIPFSLCFICLEGDIHLLFHPFYRSPGFAALVAFIFVLSSIQYLEKQCNQNTNKNNQN
jgi:hypothetical protein